MEIDLYVMVALKKDKPRLFQVILIDSQPGLYNAIDVKSGSPLIKTKDGKDTPTLGVTITTLMHAVHLYGGEVYDGTQVKHA